MSYWTHIRGSIEVSPMGRTQHEKEYVLKTVLDHLPRVTGSENDMNIHVIQKVGTNLSSSCDEFGDHTNNLTDLYGTKSERSGWLRVQTYYILTVEGDLRDRIIEETKREFLKWLTRLSKRVFVTDVLVRIYNSDEGEILLNEHYGSFSKIHEEPTWATGNIDGEPNWCEYLMWDNAKNDDYPAMLKYKYIYDKENDAEIQRRLEYQCRKK